MYTLQTFSTFLDAKIRNMRHVALIAHQAPDGDALGSLEGLRYLLETNYRDLSASVILPPEKQYDTHVTWILRETCSTVPSDAELILFLDASHLSRTALTPDQYPTQEIITIDHHEPQEGSIEGYRDISASSTTVILTDIARELKWSVTSHAATALLLGVYTDTGGFIHRNSNQHAFETAAFLIGQ